MDVGGNLEIIIRELLNKGQESTVVYDDFDFRITPGQLTKDHQNTDNHWISQGVTFDQIQYCEKVMQAECANFVLCSPDFSHKTSQKSSSRTL